MSPQENSPFHSGERVLQLRAKARNKADKHASNINCTLSPRSMLRLESQRIAFFSVVDSEGYPACSVLLGDRNFVSAQSKHAIEIDWSNVLDRTLEQYCTKGASIAFLMPDFDGKKRLRINGNIDFNANGYMCVHISQAYTNGAQYAHRRRDEQMPPQIAVPKGGDLVMRELNNNAAILLGRADTIVIASRHPDLTDKGIQGLDISIREGLPGFISLQEPNKLFWEEYHGNSFFNTLGNLSLDTRCSILAVDSVGAVALRISVKSTIVRSKYGAKKNIGTGRWICLEVDAVERIPDYLSAVTKVLHYSPKLAGTLPKNRPCLSWQEAIVSTVETKDPDTVFLHLKSCGPAPLLPFLAGQHVKIRVPAERQCHDSEHTFSLSHYALNPDVYVVTVRRRQRANGVGVFEKICKAAMNGDPVMVSEPVGDFVLPDNLDLPLVFISESIGMAPIIAILEYISQIQSGHPVWVLYSPGRNGECVFKRKVDELKRKLPGSRWILCDGAILPVGEENYSRVINIDALKRLLPFDGYCFYISGFDDLLSRIYPGLKSIGIPDSQIYLESFGPANIDTEFSQITENALPVRRTVHFVKSGISARWEPGSGSLLDLAERHGIDAPYSCRSGMCGTCSQKLLSGQIAYGRTISANAENSYILLCSSLPASDVEINI